MLSLSSHLTPFVSRPSVFVVAVHAFAHPLALVDGFYHGLLYLLSLGTTRIHRPPAPLTYSHRPRRCPTPPPSIRPVPPPPMRAVGHYTLFYHGLLIAAKRCAPPLWELWTLRCDSEVSNSIPTFVLLPYRLPRLVSSRLAFLGRTRRKHPRHGTPRSSVGRRPSARCFATVTVSALRTPSLARGAPDSKDDPPDARNPRSPSASASPPEREGWTAGRTHTG